MVLLVSTKGCKIFRFCDFGCTIWLRNLRLLDLYNLLRFYWLSHCLYFTTEYKRIRKLNLGVPILPVLAINIFVVQTHSFRFVVKINRLQNARHGAPIGWYSVVFLTLYQPWLIYNANWKFNAVTLSDTIPSIVLYIHLKHIVDLEDLAKPRSRKW